jgi:N-acetylmuramoyl-L-alanine amidase
MVLHHYILRFRPRFQWYTDLPVGFLIRLHGISGEYNDEYYIPEFGNLQWADCVTRQVTVAASNRAVGLFPATEEDVLWEIAIPSARISLGYVTNAAERQLLIQENYQKKLAQGIAEAINEVYTNTQ